MTDFANLTKPMAFTEPTLMDATKRYQEPSSSVILLLTHLYLVREAGRVNRVMKDMVDMAFRRFGRYN